MTTGQRAAEAVEEEPPRRISIGGVIALVVLAAVIVAGLVVAMLTNGGRTVEVGGGSGGSSQTGKTARPEDPVAAPPDPVGSVSGTVVGDVVAWTWVDAGEAQSGSRSASTTAAPVDRYIYTASRPGEEDILHSTQENSVSIAAVPGENCIEVVAVSADGRQSDPVEECVTVGE